MFPNDEPVSGDDEVEDEMESSSGDEDAETGDDDEDDDGGSDEDDDDDGDCSSSDTEVVQPGAQRNHQIESGSESDMSDGQADRCAICLSRYMGQEIGSPNSCDHTYCAECILEWSKNMTTCPVDRLPFTLILVRSQIDGLVTRKVTVGARETDEEAEHEDATFCEICEQSDREDRMLLCDGCDLGFHLECLNPPLRTVPIEEWFCPTCAADNRQNMAETVDIEDGELMSLLDQQPTVVGPRTVRTRLLPRTQQSERVRQVIQRRRAVTNGPLRKRKARKKGRGKRRKSKGKPKSSSSLKSSSSSTVKRWRRRRRRRRRKVTRKVKVARVPVAKTPRERIAEQLGAQKILPKHFLPVVSASSQSRMGTSDGGISTLRLFGERNELIAFDDCSDEVNADSGTEVATRNYSQSRRRLKSNMALLSHQSLAHQVPSTSSSFDLLGSILSCQTQLQLPSQGIRIERDGSLRINRDKVLTQTTQHPSDPINGPSSNPSQRAPTGSCSTSSLSNDRTSSTSVDERCPNVDSFSSTLGSSRREDTSAGEGGGGDGNDGSGGDHVDSHAKIGKKKKKVDEEKKKVDDDDIDIYSDIAPGFENDDVESDAEPINFPGGLEELSLMDGDSRVSSTSGPHPDDNAEVDPAVDSEDDLVIDESVKHDEENAEDERPQSSAGNEESGEGEEEEDEEEEEEEEEQEAAVDQDKELVDEKESPDSPVEDAPLQTEDISSDEQEVEQGLDKTEVEESNDDDEEGDEAQEATYRSQQDEEDEGDENDDHNEVKEDENVEDDEMEAETVEHEEGGGEEEEEEDEEEEQQETVEDNDDDLEEAIEEEEEEEIPLEKEFETLPENDDDIEIIEPVETGNDVEDDDDVIVTEVRKVSNNRNRLKNEHGGRRRERRRSGESNSSRHRRHRSSPHHGTSNSSSSRRHSKSGGGRGGYEEGELYEANAHRFKPSSSSSSSKYERKTRDGDDYDRASRVANVSELPRAQKSRHDSRERSEKQQKEEDKQNEDKHEGRLGDAESRSANQGGESGGEISWKKLSQSSKTRNYRDNRTRLEQHHLRLAERQKRERDRQSNTQSTPPQPPPPPLPPPVVANISSSSASNSHEKEEKRRDKKHSEHSRRERERRSTSSSNRRESNERRHSDKRKSDKHSHTNVSTSNNSVSTTSSRDSRPIKQHRHSSTSGGGGNAVGRVGSSSRDSGGSHTRDRTKDRRDRKEAKKEKIKRELERIECEEKHRERKRERALAAVSPPAPPPPPLPPSSPPSVSPVNASPPSTIESKEVYASGDKIIINVNFGRSKQSDRERSKKRHHQPSDVSDEKEVLTKKKRTKYDHYRPKGIQSPPTPPWNPFAPADELEESAKEDEDSEQEVEEEEFIDDDVEDEETRESGSPVMAVDCDDEEAEAEDDGDDNSSIQESVEGDEEDQIEPEAGSGSQAKEDMNEEDDNKDSSKCLDDNEEGEEENSVYDPFEPTKSPSSDKENDVKRNDGPPPLPPELPPLPPEPAPEDPTSSSNTTQPVTVAATAAQAGVSTTCTSVTAPINVKLDFQPPTSVQTPSNINPNFTAPVLSMPPPPTVLPPPPTPITMANIRVPPPNYLSRPPPQLPNFPWQMGAAAAAANILFRPNFLSHPPPPIHTGSGAAAGNATVAAAAATQIRTLLHNQAAQLALLSSLRPALPPQLTLPPLQQPQFAAPTTLPQQTSNLNAGVNGESGKQQLDTTEVVDMDVDSPYSPGDTLDSAPPTSNNNNSETSDNKKGMFDALLGTSQSRKENVPTRFSNSGGSGGGGGKMRPSSGGGPSASSGKASGNSSSTAHRSHRTKTDSHRKHIVRFEMTGGGAKGGAQAGGGGGTGAAGKKDDGKKEVVAKMDESQLKILDELPSSAVEMQVKEKFLKKLNRQERVIEEVKLAVKPYYNRREINKEEYKEILRKSVPKICHNKSGEINPVKIKALVEGYVKKFKYQHKKDAKGSGGKRS